MTVPAALRTAVIAGGTAVAVLLGSPAFAAHRDDGDQPGQGLTALETFLIFGVVPVALFLVIALLVSAPSMARGPRYRADRGWQAEPQVFGAPRGTQLPSGATLTEGPAVEGASGHQTDEHQSGEATDEPASEGGGASARW